MLTQDKFDELQACVIQLCAGLELTYGACGPSFQEADGEIQDSYLWMLAEKAQHCRKLLNC